MLRYVHFAILFFSLTLFANAQSRRVRDHSPSLIPDSDKKAPGITEHEEELLRRAEIRRYEEAHKEMVERAKESAQLGSQLHSNFAKSKSLGSEEIKWLDRMEKLAKKIRDGSGGSDDKEPLQSPPRDVAAALSLLAEISGELDKRVAKTSRYVTSTSVIKTSNEIIELIRYIRGFEKK